MNEHNTTPPVMQVNELDLTEAQLEGMALTTMRRRGSLFQSYLAAAWLAADPESAAKLRATFGTELAYYRRMALGVVQ